MLELQTIRINQQSLRKEIRTHHCTGGSGLLFSWSVASDRGDNRQASCRVVVTHGGKALWDSGVVNGSEQSAYCSTEGFPRGVKLEVGIHVEDAYGEKSAVKRDYFYLCDTNWEAGWIGMPGYDKDDTYVIYLRKEFQVGKPVESARLYVCGIGYQKAYLDGAELDDYTLDPAVTEYTKDCQYVTHPDLALGKGTHCLGIAVGRGWRDNRILRNVDANPTHRIPYIGEPQATAQLELTYADGTKELLVTDASWQAGRGAYVENDIFNGVTYDARLENAWSACGFKGDGWVAAEAKKAPGGKMVPMMLPPIRSIEERKPISQWTVNGKLLLDFGQNLAGVITLKIPAGMAAGSQIVLRHSEELNEDGDLYTATLRSAKATDTYICSGKEGEDTWFKPMFTYHGFRYASVEGLGNFINPDTIIALSLRNDLDNDSFFRCGSALVNQIHDNCVETERGNTHGLLTDCPQRDERMGWMNDATVRFEAFPYRFETAPIFRKIARDLRNEQSEQGGITCTAPLVFGQNPADPVCSSFLITGKQCWLFNKDIDMLRENYEGFKGWADCLLLHHSDDGIVNYSYYGDWASPAYACAEPEGARSGVTPGIFMSTGYSYYNLRTVSEFATILGKDDDAEEYAEKAEYVRKAIMDKWYNAETKKFSTGSQACQTFMLWLGLFPSKEDAAIAAKGLRDELRLNNFRFTTGNLCTRYLFEVLCDYGYVEDAWTLITKEDYPSFGYMIQQEATTIWERFELKKNAGMNSHNHPMYGAVYYWFYAYLAGVKPLEAGCDKVRIAPVIPSKLMSVHCQVETIKGNVMVRWFKRYEKMHLLVSIPFGMTAQVEWGGSTYEVASGFHTFEY